jgi:hypothetical protein
MVRLVVQPTHPGLLRVPPTDCGGTGSPVRESIRDARSMREHYGNSVSQPEAGERAA